MTVEYIFILHVCVGFAYRYFPTESINTLSGHRLQNRLAKTREVPHHVLIVFNNVYCSGSLITSRIAVTAASCLFKYRSNALVKVGADSITGDGEVIPVQEVKIHEYFRHLSSLDNDIAMVIMRHDVTFRQKVGKAILLEPDVALYEGSLLSVSGYGANVTKPDSSHPHSLSVSEMILLGKSTCKEIFGSLITASNFCAQYNLEQRLNENGGGALHNNFLVGILSYDVMDAEEPHAAVFTNISYFYKWLKLNTFKFNIQDCAKNQFALNSRESVEYT